MKKLFIYSVIFSLSFTPLTLLAQELSLNQLQAKLSELESILNNSKHSNALSNLEISGAMEVEATHTEGLNDSQDNASNTSLATFEMAMLAPINQHTQAMVTFLYEEEDTPFEVDTASINLSLEPNLNLTLGQVYLPFGAYESQQVNDTLALEIAETRNSALMVGYESNGFSAQGYVFQAQENKLNQGGLRVGFRNQYFNVFIDYINNALNSPAFESLTEEEGPLSALGDTPAISLHLGAQVAGIVFQCEHLTIDSVNELDITASQLEASYQIQSISLALSFQQTHDAQILGLPQQRTSLTTALDIMPSTQLALEIWSDEDENNHSSNNLVIQAAVNF